MLRLKAKIKAMTKRGTTLDGVRDKIEAMNYLLRGWANYFRHHAASRTFRYVGSYAFQRMEVWLRKKTGQRVRAIYRRYYRRDPQGHLTWNDGRQYLYHPAYTKIEHLRYAHHPNPYLDATKEVYLTYHHDPYPGKRDWWGEATYYGEDWSEVREGILERDGNRCRLCGAGAGRVEVHHIQAYEPGMAHEPSNLITLCATCHRQVRNPQSESSRNLARITP